MTATSTDGCCSARYSADSLKPTIAACNGPAVGVGVTMQLAMDIRLASTEARYGFVFARRGLNPEAASSWFLPHLVGPQTALEWCYTGRVFPAQEAFDKGLVRSLHAPDELLPAARALAREIIDNTAPVSIALTRQMIWRMAGADHPMEAHRADSRAIIDADAIQDPHTSRNPYAVTDLNAFRGLTLIPDGRFGEDSNVIRSGDRAVSCDTYVTPDRDTTVCRDDGVFTNGGSRSNLDAAVVTAEHRPVLELRSEP